MRYLPPFLRGLGPVSEWIALWGIRRFAAKYTGESSQASEAKVGG